MDGELRMNQGDRESEIVECKPLQREGETLLDH